MDLVHMPTEPREPQFASVEVLALERLVSDDAANAVAYARGLAKALAGPDRTDVRLRVFSKALGTERALQVLLEHVLADRVARGDLHGVKVANEALRGCVVRMERLATAHRLESNVGLRPTLMIAHADSVHVGT
jgi:hypothetical protein